ncbi:MAG: hypothetical protein OXK77_05760 [Gemmatimonadota bacterium]|nr:hypothetical protein [Gemmatimonadota bacterium]MDE2866044.1 hypothetical protein [Gemmatimonadota bacterium]
MNDSVDDPRPIDVHDPDKGPESPSGENPLDSAKPLTIRIDRKEYRVPPELLNDGKLTGQQIRRLPRPNIGPDRDLFEVVPGGSDRKIDTADGVFIRNHMRFFSAPAVINPGCVCGQVARHSYGVSSVNGGGRNAAQ